MSSALPALAHGEALTRWRWPSAASIIERPGARASRKSRPWTPPRSAPRSTTPATAPIATNDSSGSRAAS